VAGPLPSRTFESFFTPRFPLSFLVGGLALAVAGNILSDLLKIYLGAEARRLWLIFILVLALLLAFVLLAHGLQQVRARFLAASGYLVSEHPRPKRHKGLIAFVSQPEHLEKAIDYHSHTLEQVWLLTTDESRAVAQDIVDKHSTIKRAFTIVPIKNQWDLPEARLAVEGIYRTRLGDLAEEDVIADFTGGTKPMTVGMIFACLNPSRHLEYVPARYVNKRLVGSMDPIEYFLQPAAPLSKSEERSPERTRSDEEDGQLHK
jgi:hypothetical protein